MLEISRKSSECLTFNCFIRKFFKILKLKKKKITNRIINKQKSGCHVEMRRVIATLITSLGTYHVKATTFFFAIPSYVSWSWTKANELKKKKLRRDSCLVCMNVLYVAHAHNFAFVLFENFACCR